MLGLHGAIWRGQAYINEKAAPELLQYAQELVDSTQKGITEQVDASVPVAAPLFLEEVIVI